MQNCEPATDEAWERALPHLDEAMAELKEPDRSALLLRFFKGRPLREVGMELGIGEDAARMRVNRALDKLRGLLLRKGLALSSVALVTKMTEVSVQAISAERARLVQQMAVLRMAGVIEGRPPRF